MKKQIFSVMLLMSLTIAPVYAAQVDTGVVEMMQELAGKTDIPSVDALAELTVKFPAEAAKVASEAATQKALALSAQQVARQANAAAEALSNVSNIIAARNANANDAIADGIVQTESFAKKALDNVKEFGQTVGSWVHGKWNEGSSFVNDMLSKTDLQAITKEQVTRSIMEKPAATAFGAFGGYHVGSGATSYLTGNKTAQKAGGAVGAVGGAVLANGHLTEELGRYALGAYLTIQALRYFGGTSEKATTEAGAGRMVVPATVNILEPEANFVRKHVLSGNIKIDEDGDFATVSLKDVNGTVLVLNSDVKTVITQFPEQLKDVVIKLMRAHGANDAAQIATAKAAVEAVLA